MINEKIIESRTNLFKSYYFNGYTEELHSNIFMNVSPAAFSHFLYTGY